MTTLHVVRPVVKDVYGVPHYGPEEVVEDESLLGGLVGSLLRGAPEGLPVVQLTEWGHLMVCYRRENVAVLVTEFRGWTRGQLEEFLGTRSSRE